MLSIPNTLNQLLWSQWLHPAFQAATSPDPAFFDPLLLNSPRLALELAQSIQLQQAKALDFLAYLTEQAQIATTQAQRPVFWLHLQAFYLGWLLESLPSADYLSWLQTQPQPDSRQYLVKPSLLLWSCPPVLAAVQKGEIQLNWLPGKDLSPKHLSTSYNWILEQFFPYRYQVQDLFDTVWLVHLMAWLQPVYASSNWKTRLQATPLLIQALRRTNQAESWLRAFGQSLHQEQFREKLKPDGWQAGYQALLSWLDEIKETADLQNIRDELFRELDSPRSTPQERILRKIQEHLSRPESKRSTHLISLHAFMRTPQTHTHELSYLPVETIWAVPEAHPPTAQQSVRIKPGRQNLPFLMHAAGTWKQAWQIGRKSQDTPDYRLRLCWEQSLRSYTEQTSALDLDVFKRMRAQQVFEIVCLPHTDFYFAWILLILLYLRAEPKPRQETFFTTQLEAPLKISGYAGAGPCSWTELLQQCGLKDNPERQLEMLDGLHRLSCHPRLSLSPGAAVGWHLLGEAASYFCQALEAGCDCYTALTHSAQSIVQQVQIQTQSYWLQTPEQERLPELPGLDQLTASEFLSLNPFPLLLSEIHQHLEQPGSGYFFFLPLSQERLTLDLGSTLVPAAFLTGNLKQLTPQAAWPFVNTRYRELIACIGELNRFYLDTVFIAQRAEDQERVHQLESEKRELAAENARVAHLQGIDEDLQSLIKGIRQLRQQAIQLQNRVFPGTYGILSLREDFEWLYEHDRSYEFRLILNPLFSTQTKPLNDLEKARELLGLQQDAQDPKVTLIQELSIQPEHRGKPSRGYLFKTMHSDTGLHFDTAWPDYLPILFAQALYLKLPLLTKIILESQALNGNLATSHSLHERQLFRLLKSLIHRSHSPLRYGQGSQRRYLLNLEQLLGVLLDAWSWDSHYSLQIEYFDQTQAEAPPVNLINIQNLLKICPKIAVDDKESEQALRRSQAVLLAPGVRPVELLTPLYQLISHELRPGTEPEACQLTRICLHNGPTDWVLRLICRNRLPAEALRSEYGERSGLSSCLLKLAQALNTELPEIIQTPGIQQALPTLWVHCYQQEQQRPAGRIRKTESIAYTEIGLRLKTGVESK